LQSMAERVAEVGGTLQAGPTPTGGRVQASLPLGRVSRIVSGLVGSGP
jgi:signal transduction histidine kinase